MIVGFKFQMIIYIIIVNFGDDFFIIIMFIFVGVYDFYLLVVGFGIMVVYMEQIVCEQCCFVVVGFGLDFEEGVMFVIRIFWQ